MSVNSIPYVYLILYNVEFPHHVSYNIFPYFIVHGMFKVTGSRQLCSVLCKNIAFAYSTNTAYTHSTLHTTWCKPGSPRVTLHSITPCKEHSINLLSDFGRSSSLAGRCSQSLALWWIKSLYNGRVCASQPLSTRGGQCVNGNCKPVEMFHLSLSRYRFAGERQAAGCS